MEDQNKKTLSDLIYDIDKGAMRFVEIEAPRVHSRIIGKWNELRDTLNLIIKQQDEIIGQLTREVMDLRDTATRRAEWLRKAKQGADAPLNESFDNVWKRTLEKAKKFDSIDMSRDEVEKYIDDYIDMGCFKNPEVARPYLLDGFTLYLNRAKKTDSKKEESEC